MFAATFLAVRLIDGSSGSGPVETGRRGAGGASPTPGRPTPGSPRCRRAIDDGTSRPGPYAALGDAYLQKARETFDPSYYARAETALREALRRDPRDAGALTAMGVLANARHDFAAGAPLRRAGAGGGARTPSSRTA